MSTDNYLPTEPESDNEILAEYDFSLGERGKYREEYKRYFSSPASNTASPQISSTKSNSTPKLF